MVEIKKVAIVGVGLIGSSLALCIKKEFPKITLIGFSQDEAELKGAIETGIIDTYGLDLQDVVKEADVILLCTPVMVTLTLIETLSCLELKKEVIITDVCSTKQKIMAKSHLLENQNVTFIGGHPMAGSHKSGYLAADKELFENAYYVLVSENRKNEEKKTLLKKLLRGTASKFVELDALQHDKITGVLSHMPHLIAAQLVGQAKLLMTDMPEALHLAAGGFRDMTRIASSDPRMWTEISLSNPSVLVEEINQWTTSLSDLKEMLIHRDEAGLFQFFKGNKDVRDTIPVHKEGSIPSFHDLYLNVPDTPGAIAEVTGLLAHQKISLVNIKIMETRDDIFGVLCLSFKNEKDLDKAQNTIENQTDYEWVNQ